MNLIACVDEAGGIGRQNALLYHLQADKAFFKEKTAGNVVVMGRKTLESLPQKAPLPNRVNVVMTSQSRIEGCICAKDESELFRKLRDFSDRDIYVIGGQQIYEALLPCCRTAYITKVYMKKPADAFFPAIDHMANWVLKSRSRVFSEEGIRFCFEVYENTDVKESAGRGGEG